MLLRLLVLPLLLFTSVALAEKNYYDVEFKWSIGSKQQMSGTLSLAEGVTGLMEERGATSGSFIEVVASEGKISDRTGTLLNLVLGNIDSKGKKTVIAKPQILVTSKDSSTVSIKPESGDEVSVSVIVNKNVRK